MTSNSFHQHRLAFAVACIVLVVAALVDRRTLPAQETALPSSGAGPIDPMVALAGPAASPEVLIALSASGGPPLPPTATPTPTPPPRGPEWVQTRRETSLSPISGIPPRPELKVPQGSYLKTLAAQGGRFLVYFEGDHRGKNEGEAWVDGTEVSLSSAPRWVMARQPATLRMGRPVDSPALASLPRRTVLEVLEDAGSELKVFYLGDGVTRNAFEGWVHAADLVAAGATIRADNLGGRWLSESDVEALQDGNGIWLEVPYRSQLDGSPSASANCGPASVAMVLGFHKHDVPTAELRALAHQLQGTSGSETGFAIEYLQELVERFGLRGEDLYAGRGLRRWTLEDVRRHLARGHPVIAELRFRLMPGRDDPENVDDHYVVIVGVKGNDFIYNDSVDDNGTGHGRLISAEALVRAWGGSYFPFAAFAVSGP